MVSGISPNFPNSCFLNVIHVLNSELVRKKIRQKLVWNGRKTRNEISKHAINLFFLFKPILMVFGFEFFIE